MSTLAMLRVMNLCVLVVLLVVRDVHGYCLSIGANPGFTGAPNVQQVRIYAVQILSNTVHVQILQNSVQIQLNAVQILLNTYKYH